MGVLIVLNEKIKKLNFSMLISFLLIGVLIFISGIVSVYKLTELSQLTTKLYEHPLKVTSATKSIQTTSFQKTLIQSL